MSSQARILVDNLAVTHGRSGRTPRTLSLAELEDWLAAKAIVWGSERMLRLRDEAVALAQSMGTADRVAKINRLFDQLAGRLPLRPTAGRFLRAFTHGRAWDDQRVEMFNRLIQGLTGYEDPDVPDWLPAGSEAEALPFFESYFSNYIEGTVFTVAEARHIIDTQQPPASRPADGHDILGTYRCVADTVGRRATSEEPEELISHLCERHRMILGGRPEMRPGRWKLEPNRVGAYLFVDPKLVEGTLRRGFEMASSVPTGFLRALFVMVMASEVHPFTDGNGRVARVMMNAELSAVDAARDHHSQRLPQRIHRLPATHFGIGGSRRIGAGEGDELCLAMDSRHALGGSGGHRGPDGGHQRPAGSRRCRHRRHPAPTALRQSITLLRRYP